MGGNIARRLMRSGHEIVAFDRKASAVEQLERDGATGVGSLEAMRTELQAPAAFWVMLPAGAPTEEAVASLGALAAPGDIVVDGGNTRYKDDIRRARKLAERGVRYIDVGTSGGVWGLKRGYCLMIGGPEDAVCHLQPIFEALAPGSGPVPRTPGRPEGDPAERGYAHVGPAGAGHFVKMVHNGIEYGLMQAYAEGFDILKSRSSELLPQDERFELDLTDIAEVWRRGSVVSSWLLDLTSVALTEDASLSRFSGHVSDSGEGHWTIEAAMESAVPVHVLSAALFARYRSRARHTFGDQLLSAMRAGFGGHVEVPQ